LSANKGIPVWVIILCAVLIFLPIIQHAARTYTSDIIPWPRDEDVEYTREPVTEGVTVNRPITFSTPDFYGGSQVSTGNLYLYDERGVLQESLDISSSKTTSDPYTSGTNLYAQLINSNAKKTWAITVPTMSQADVDSQTNNPIKLNFFAIGSYTTKATDQAGNQISDGGNYNHSATGDSATLSVGFWVSSDNTGIMDSGDVLDPIDKLHWWCVLYLKVFNTNYEYIDISGFDYSWSRGSANWYATVLTDTDLTKWKVGSSYEYDGATAFTHSADFTSYTGGDADLQYYLEFYSDPDYYIDHGNAGPDHYQAAELTINAIS
jgi:hypothetical protein